MADKPELVVSFWDISLPNFPEGNFRQRKLSTEDAVPLINQTKETGVVSFATEADIGAPYNKRQLEKTKALVGVLREHHGVNVHIEDFFSEFEEGMSSALPTGLYDIRSNRPILVVTCSYTMDRKPTVDDLGMSILPESVTFHLFELMASNAP